MPVDFENNKSVDWDKRSKELEKIIEEAKSKSDNWDCVIPSSGGKDSTYQAIWAKSKTKPSFGYRYNL